MASSPAFKYAPMFQLGEDKTEYRLLSKEGITLSASWARQAIGQQARRRKRLLMVFIA